MKEKSSSQSMLGLQDLIQWWANESTRPRVNCFLPFDLGSNVHFCWFCSISMQHCQNISQSEYEFAPLLCSKMLSNQLLGSSSLWIRSKGASIKKRYCRLAVTLLEYQTKEASPPDLLSPVKNQGISNGH